MPGSGLGTGEMEMKRTQSVSSKERNTGVQLNSTVGPSAARLWMQGMQGGEDHPVWDLGFGGCPGVHHEKEGRGGGGSSRPGNSMIRKKGRYVLGTRESGSGGREGRNKGSHVQGLQCQYWTHTGDGEPLKVCEQEE